MASGAGTAGASQAHAPLRPAAWVAKRLGISRWAVYELVKRGKLPHVKLGRLVRFDEELLEAFIRNGGTPDDSDPPPASIARIGPRR